MTIMTLEQYDSMIELLEFLELIGISSADKTHEDFIVNHADEWMICDYCAELKCDCSCEDDSMHGRYAAEYDDEASF